MSLTALARTRMKAAGLALALIVGPLTTAGAQAASWCVAVWYPSSDQPGGFETILDNADVVDVVFPFWYTPDADGRVLSRAGADWREQVAAWKGAGLVVMPSVFATHSGFLAEPRRSAHVAALLALVDENGYDGLDLDYEEFPLSTREPFSELVEALGAGLHARGKLLSVTVHAKTEAEPGSYPSAAAQDWPRLAAVADVFNVMTYDYTNRNEPPGPVAPRSWVADVVTYGLGAVGAGKLQLGLPFYGYVWKRGRPPAAATTWEATRRLIDQFKLDAAREPDSGELTADLNVTGLPRQTVYVSDALTLAGRLADLAGRGLATAGVAIWGIGGEDPATWQVLRDARPAECRLRASAPTG
ncbi:MAG: hypothetical protein IT345_00720 [Trueperaceae bacterium]|nr:hypothetical protein [Trueperaceae bacterium]